MTTTGTITVYQWRAWNDFLIERLVPEAFVVAAAFEHTVDDVLPTLPSEVSAFLPHLACSVTTNFPVCRLELFSALESRSIRVLNRNVVDISKKALQACCTRAKLPTSLAAKEGDPEELVIVKTNSNFGGKNELTLSDGQRSSLGVRKHSKDVIKGPYQYLVRPRKEIPEGWWTDDNLIIETYIDNEKDIYYRCWITGDHLALIEMSNPARVKKMGKSRLLRHWMINLKKEAEPTLSAPDAPARMVDDLVVFKKHFALDFGSVDIVVDQDRVPYIIDVNSTPYYNTQLEVPGMTEHLAAGLRF